MGKEPELKIKVKVDPQLDTPQKLSNEIQVQIDKIKERPAVKVEADIGNFSVSLSKKLKKELKVVNASLSYYLSQFESNTNRMNAVANSLFADLDFSKRINLEFDKVKDEIGLLKNELNGADKAFETVFANNKIKSKDELISSVEILGKKLKDVFDIGDPDLLKKKLESIYPTVKNASKALMGISELSNNKKFTDRYGFTSKELKRLIEPVSEFQDALETISSMLDFDDFSEETISDFINDLGDDAIGLDVKVTEACKSILTTFTTVQDKIYKEIENSEIDISPVGFDKTKLDEISKAYTEVMANLVSQQAALNAAKKRTVALENTLVGTTKKNVEAVKEQVEQIKSIFADLAESPLGEQVKTVADYSFEQNKDKASNSELLRRNEEKAKAYEDALKNIETKVKALTAENGLLKTLSDAFVSNGSAASTAAEFIKAYTLAVGDAKTAGVPPSLQKTGITGSSINAYAEKLASVQKKLLELKDTTLPNFESALCSNFRYMFDPLIDNANSYKEALGNISSETSKKASSKNPTVPSQGFNSANVNNYAKLIDAINKSILDMKTTVIPDFDKVLNENGLKIAQIGLSLKDYIETLKQGVRAVERTKAVPANSVAEQAPQNPKTVNITKHSVENIRDKVATELSNIPVDIKSENIKIPTDPISLVGKIDVPSTNITVDGKAIPDVIIDQKPKKTTSKKKKQVEGQISFDDISTEQLETAAEKAAELMSPVALPGSIRIKKDDVTVNDFKVSIPGKVHLKKDDVVTNNFKVDLPGKVVIKSEDVVTPSAPIDIPVNAVISKKDDAGVIPSLNDEAAQISSLGEGLSEASRKINDYQENLGAVGTTSQYAAQQVDWLNHVLDEQITDFDRLDEKIKQYLTNLEKLNPVELNGRINITLKDITVPKKITLNGDLLIANATKEINEAAKKAEKKKKKAISTAKNEDSADSKKNKKEKKEKTPEELQKEYLNSFSGLYKKIMRTMNARDKSAGKLYDGTYVEDLDAFLSGKEFDSYLDDLKDRLKTTIGLLNGVSPDGGWRKDSIYRSAIKDGQHERKNYLYTERDKEDLLAAKKEQEDYLSALKNIPELRSKAFDAATNYGESSELYRLASEKLTVAEQLVASYENSHSEEFLNSISQRTDIKSAQWSEGLVASEKGIVDGIVQSYSDLQDLYKKRETLFSDKDLSRLTKIDAEIQKIELSIASLTETAKNRNFNIDEIPSIVKARDAFESAKASSDSTFKMESRRSDVLEKIGSKIKDIQDLFKLKESLYKPEDLKRLTDVNDLIESNCSLIDDLIDEYESLGGSLTDPKILSILKKFKDSQQKSESNLEKNKNSFAKKDNDANVKAAALLQRQQFEVEQNAEKENRKALKEQQDATLAQQKLDERGVDSLFDQISKNVSKIKTLYNERSSLVNPEDIDWLAQVDNKIQNIIENTDRLIENSAIAGLDITQFSEFITLANELKDSAVSSNFKFDKKNSDIESKANYALLQEQEQQRRDLAEESEKYIAEQHRIALAQQKLDERGVDSTLKEIVNKYSEIVTLEQKRGKLFKDDDVATLQRVKDDLSELYDTVDRLITISVERGLNPLQFKEVTSAKSAAEKARNYADIDYQSGIDREAKKTQDKDLNDLFNEVLKDIDQYWNDKGRLNKTTDVQLRQDIENNIKKTAARLRTNKTELNKRGLNQLQWDKIHQKEDNRRNDNKINEKNAIDSKQAKDDAKQAQKDKQLQTEIEAKKREYLKLLDEINKLLTEQASVAEDGLSQQEAAKLADDIKKKQAELKGVKSFLTSNMSVGDWNDFERLKIDPKRNAFARAGERQINKDIAAEEKKNADDLAKKAKESESYVKKYEQSVDRYLKAKEAFDNADNLADWYKTRNEYENALEDMTSLEDYITGQSSIIDNAEYFDRYKKASDKAVLGENALAEALRRRQEAQRAALATNDEDLKSLNQFIAQVENMQGALEKNLATDTPEYSSLLSFGNKSKSLFQFLDANPFDKNFAAQRWGQSVGYTDIKTLEDAFAKLRKEAAEAKIPVQEIRTDLEKLTKMTRNKTRVANLSSELNDYLEKFPKVGSSLADEVRELQKALSDPDAWKNAGELGLKMAELRKNAKELGLESENLYDKFKRLFGQHLGTAIVMGALHKMQEATRVIYQNVVNIDTAMAELRKVTNLTSDGYKDFMNAAVEQATKLGVGIDEYINSTADWARLGYDSKEAENLAKYSNLLRNVGDGIDDVNTASSYLISTLQGFKLDSSEVEHVVDVINSVANTQPITAEGIGEVLSRSSAAMSAAGNTLEETIALGVAANAVVQDADSVGTALKSLSMYLRAAKSDLEDAGESTDGCADSVSELRSELKALTGVDVMADAAGTQFKSTYQIIKELSEVWDTLSDVTKANVTEMIGGKRNANIVSALLENFGTAESALASATTNITSAWDENEIHLDSIQGRVSQLDAAFQSLSTHILDSEIPKFFISTATAITKGVDALVQFNGAIPSLTFLGTMMAQLGRPKMTGFTIVPSNTLVVTRSERTKSAREYLAKPTNMVA